MQARKILFPTDLSTNSNEGLRWATALARDSGAQLIIAHVEEPPVAYGGGELYLGAEAGATEELRQALVKVLPTDPAVRFEHKLLVGDPASAIVDLAESENVDLIVMSTHGRRGLTRVLMGSVAEVVVRRAKCPVLTVKQPESGEA